MSSRRRNSKKNLGNSLSDIQRRLRRMERKPIRTRLQNRVIKGSAIAPSTITAEEVSFGTTVITTDTPADVVDNPKEGTTVVDPDTGSAQVYDTFTESFIEITDATARASADGKNTIYRQTAQPTGGSYVTGDTWFDSDDNNKIYRYDGTSWVAVQLGGNGLANINANAITAGTIDASLITVSNLDAGNITTGTLDAITITSGGLTINSDGSITTSSGKFGVSAGGVVTATGVDITGEINASSGTFSGTITATGTISGGTISGATVTGGTFRTAASGTRIEMTSSTSNILYFYGSTSEPGALRVDSDNINLWAPASTFGDGAEITMYSDTYTISPSGVFITGGTSKALNFSMSSTTITLNQGTYGISINASGVKAVGAAAEASEVIRNIRITETAPTSGGDSSAYTNGTVVLVREA